MKILATIIASLAAFVAQPIVVHAQERPASEIFAAPIGIERQSPVTQIPIIMRYGKLHIDASINDRTSEFLFDTGSPTVLAKDFADTLDLEIVGRNTGVDSHGNEVTMQIGIVDRLTLGDTTFRNVPVLIHDFSNLGMGRCLIGNGLIGSEIFAGSAWRIDTQNALLSISERAADFPASDRASLRTTLYDVGYPHAPIVDYRIGELVDKAMFDTGNAAHISFFERAADHPSVQNAIVPGSAEQGEGYEGESAGGLSEIGPLNRFTIAEIAFPVGQLGRTDSIVRTSPPTLFGAGLLRNYIVVLDYPGRAMTLEARSNPEAIGSDPGYGIAIIDDRAVITRLFKDSVADRVGLQLGDHVVETQGRSLGQLDGAAYCDTVRWLVDEFDPSEAGEILVEREGKQLRFTLPAVE